MLHPLITWGDGLSCERHVDVQNGRENCKTAIDRLEGIEPVPQEFHNRVLLMQVMFSAVTNVLYLVFIRLQ